MAVVPLPTYKCLSEHDISNIKIVPCVPPKTLPHLATRTEQGPQKWHHIRRHHSSSQPIIESAKRTLTITSHILCDSMCKCFTPLRKQRLRLFFRLCHVFRKRIFIEHIGSSPRRENGPFGETLNQWEWSFECGELENLMKDRVLLRKELLA